MTQTYRTDDYARWGAGQGFNLSPAQVDNNFWDLIQRMIAQESLPDPAPFISHFEIIGINMYVHMSDGSVLGPYTLPVAIYRSRGDWLPTTLYSILDTVTVNSGLYVVQVNHTSAGSFDPGASDGAGHEYYGLMFEAPGSSLPSGGAPGTSLVKATTTDYSVMWGYPNAANVTFVPATGSTYSSSNVADALEEVAAEVEELAADSSAVAANVSYTPPTGSSLTADNVQDAIDELESAGSDTGSVVGRQTIWIPATAMTPRITNGPSVGTVEMPSFKNMVKTLDFDSTTIEYAQFDIVMPKSWDLAQDEENYLSFKIFWSHAATTATFGVSFVIEGTSIPNGNYLDNSFGYITFVADTGGNTNMMYVSAEVNGELPFISNYGDLIMFRIYRNPTDTNDTMTIDARLHGVQLCYTTNAATDD